MPSTITSLRVNNLKLPGSDHHFLALPQGLEEGELCGSEVEHRFCIENIDGQEPILEVLRKFEVLVRNPAGAGVDIVLDSNYVI